MKLLFFASLTLAAQMTDTSPRLMNKGTTPPATCTIGQVFFDTDAAAGQNLFGCTASDTWTLMSGSATAGSGIIVTGATVSVDTAVILSRATAQAGTSLKCTTSTSTSAPVCSLTPTLTAYTDGMLLLLDPHADLSASATLNVDTLGARKLYKMSGGSAAQIGASDVKDAGKYVIAYSSALDSGTGGFFVVPLESGGLTMTDVYWPFGRPSGSEISFNPGSTVVKAYSFTPAMNITMTKIGYLTSGTASVAFAIYTFDGSTRLTNATANCSNAVGAGNGVICSWAGSVSLTAGTTYRFAFSGDTSTGIMVSNGGTLAYAAGSGSGFSFSSTVAIGTAANTSTGSAGSLALPSTTGTISANTASITHNAYPAVVFIP